MDSKLALQQLTEPNNPVSVLKLMVGSDHIHAGKNKAEFKFYGFLDANVCRIELDEASDTYIMTFLKIVKQELVLVEKFDDLFSDSLKSTFEGYTRLYLTVPHFASGR